MGGGGAGPLDNASCVGGPSDVGCGGDDPFIQDVSCVGGPPDGGRGGDDPFI